MIFVLSSYPLSGRFRRRLEAVVHDSCEYRTLSELRHLGLVGLAKFLFRLDCDAVCIGVEEESASALVPILKLVAALPSARRRLVVNADLTESEFSRFSAVPAVASVGMASAVSAVWTLWCWVRAEVLVRAPRIVVQSSGRGVFYLNANLWFGVKAGGSVGHISGVANAFLERGEPVEFVSVGGRMMVSSDARFSPLRPPSALSIPFETTYYRFDIGCSDQCDDLLKLRRPKFIYQRMSLANISGVILSRKHRLPLVIEYNGSEAWVARNWGKPLRFQPLAELTEKIALKHAHVVVTISDVLKRELIERGVDPERIVSYPNCIDPKMFDPSQFPEKDRVSLRVSLGVPEGAVVATFVGTFGQWHGADRLATAIRRLIYERADDVRRLNLHFLLVGDGLTMPAVRETLLPVLESGRITLTGLVPQGEAPLYLASSDILLSPHVANADGSEFFGSPTKLFEYMAMGKAILASDLAQIGTVLQPSIRLGEAVQGLGDGVRPVAMLVPPGDVEALMDGIVALAKEHTLRARLGEAARELALSRYTWAHHVDAIVARMELLGYRVGESRAVD